MEKGNININKKYVKAQQSGSEKLKQTKEETSSNKVMSRLSNWKFWIIFIVILFISLGIESHGFSRLGIIIVFLSLFLLPKYVIVYIKAQQSDPEKLKQIQEEISSSKLATFLSSIPFWFIVAFILAVSLFVSEGGGSFFDIVYIFMTLPLYLMAGFPQIFEMLIPSETIKGALSYIVGIPIILLILLYWPFNLSCLHLIIKRKINSRLIIMLSLIVLLLLFLGFYGCTQVKI